MAESNNNSPEDIPMLESSQGSHSNCDNPSDDKLPKLSCKHSDSVDVKDFKEKLLKFKDIKCVNCGDNNESGVKVKVEPSEPDSIATTERNEGGDLKNEDSASSKNAETLTNPNIWICLICSEPHCGREAKGHANKHYEDNKEHALSIDFVDRRIWCYKCDDEPSINDVLTEEEDEERVQDYELAKKSRKNRVRVTAPGLSNLGNTCFFNSVMQVVVGTSVLHDILIPTNPYHNPPHIDSIKCIAATEDNVDDLTDAFKKFLLQMWRAQDSIVAPRELFSEISRKWQQFRGWRQQDSQELMRFLFDGIKSEELKLIKRYSSKPSKKRDQEICMSYDEDHSDDERSEDSDDEKQDDKKYESFIDACFGGKLVSVIVCDVCKNCSYSYEEFLDVSLPIKSPSADNDQFMKNENSFRYDNAAPYRSNSSQSDGGGSEGEETNSDAETEDGIPERARTRIELLLRDLPSDSGRSSPSLSKEPSITLRECLKSFVKVETLEGDNKFACNNCWKRKKKKEESESADDSNKHGSDMEGVEINGPGEPMEGVFRTDDSHQTEDTGSPPVDRHDDDERSSPKYGYHESTFSGTSSQTTSKPVSEPEFILRKAYKRYLFDSLPPVMVFHLKRFQQVGSRWSISASMRKIDDFVAFDEEIDLADFVIPPEIEEENEVNGINNEHIINGSVLSNQSNPCKFGTKYRLYGVVVHLGSLYNGHYIAYVLSRNILSDDEQSGVHNSSFSGFDKARDTERKNHITDDQRQWIYCSDSSIRAASVDEVLNSGAYLLFYERVCE
ncbi:747_t:CDS:10 [Funneliformis mosseae]|uniref:Ubiquitin carboxyl-terminal hydrolase n=1 Tax=Funneliformis mosseae TaxID=27381 RepID=A0A9N9B5I7_FUNMO|nr:747_t:CDS:10 [Funneliformis mosseae]